MTSYPRYFLFTSEDEATRTASLGGIGIILIDKATFALLDWVLVNSLFYALGLQGSVGVQRHSCDAHLICHLLNTDTRKDGFYDKLVIVVHGG